MQSELEFLAVAYSLFGVAIAVAIVARKLWMLVRIVEGALVFPASFLAVYGLGLVLGSIGESHLGIDFALTCLGAFLGTLSLWIALFCRPSTYEANGRLAASLLAGLLVGGGVGLSLLLSGTEWTLANPGTLVIVVPMVLAAYHMATIGRSLWALRAAKGRIP